jgi:hypothetical protein
MREEVTRRCQKLRNEEINLYSLVNIIRAMKSTRIACNTHGKDKKYMQKILVEKPEGKRPLGRPRHRCRVMDRIEMAQDKVR